MENLFFTVLGMSLTGSFVILFVLLARLALRRAPKIFSYALWAVALFRLLCPFAIESAFSLLPSVRMVDAAGRGGDTDQVIQVQTGIPALNSQVNGFLADHPYQEGQPAVIGGSPEENLTPAINQLGPVPDWRTVPAAIWLAGFAVLMGYSLFSLLRLRRRLIGSVSLEGEKDVRLADHIPSPFVLGLFRPAIYLPSGLPEGERDYILLHERTHIRRLDHVTRSLAWLAAAVHWFNPLVWLAFHLAGRDMEMSCDEAVLRKMGREIRADYSTSLLRLSQGGKLPAGPLAFGGNGFQGRIKNVLNYKKPAFWVAALALIGVLCLGVSLATNPSGPADAPEPALGLSYSYNEDGSRVVLTGSRAESMNWFIAGQSEFTPLGILSFGGLELSNGWEVIGAACWTSEDRNAVKMNLIGAPVSLTYTVVVGDSTERIIIQREVGGDIGENKEEDLHLPDEEVKELAGYFVQCIQGAEAFHANSQPADSTGIDLAYEIGQTDSGPFVRMTGKVYGQALERNAVWWPSGMEELYEGHSGGLSMRYTFAGGGAELMAWWADGEHKTVALSTKPSVLASSYLPAGCWEFTVDLSGEQGRVTAMEAKGGESTLPDPVKMYPESITDQEAVFVARIAAKLLTAAEDFYNNYDGPIPTGPSESVPQTPGPAPVSSPVPSPSSQPSAKPSAIPAPSSGPASKPSDTPAPSSEPAPTPPPEALEGFIWHPWGFFRGNSMRWKIAPAPSNGSHIRCTYANEVGLPVVLLLCRKDTDTGIVPDIVSRLTVPAGETRSMVYDIPVDGFREYYLIMEELQEGRSIQGYLAVNQY